MIVDQELLEKIDELNAIHEAGHAVMAALTSTLIHTVVSPMPTLDDHDRFGYVLRSLSANEWSEVLIGLAGPGAEVIHRQNATWTDVFRSAGRRDWRRAQRRLIMMSDQLNEPRRSLIAQAKSEVLQRLRGNWDWVKAVATALQSERYLTGEQILSLRPVTADTEQHQSRGERQSIGEPA